MWAIVLALAIVAPLVEAGTCQAGEIIAQGKCSACNYGEYTNRSTTFETGSCNSNTCQSTCLRCPAGKASGTDSQNGYSVCFDCQAGTAFNIANALNCLGPSPPSASCPSGNTQTNVVCPSCPTGYFSSTSSAASCTACAAGTFNSVAKSSTCPTCTASNFCPGTVPFHSFKREGGREGGTDAVAMQQAINQANGL
jgi:hypothetical protein